MIKSGNITLYNWDDTICSRRKYNGAYERGVILSDWKKVYGAGFLGCYYIISPIHEDTRTTKNGTNAKTRFFSTPRNSNKYSKQFGRIRRNSSSVKLITNE